MIAENVFFCYLIIIKGLNSERERKYLLIFINVLINYDEVLLLNYSKLFLLHSKR